VRNCKGDTSKDIDLQEKSIEQDPVGLDKGALLTGWVCGKTTIAPAPDIPYYSFVR